MFKELEKLIGDKIKKEGIDGVVEILGMISSELVKE